MFLKISLQVYLHLVFDRMTKNHTVLLHAHLNEMEMLSQLLTQVNHRNEPFDNKSKPCICIFSTIAFNLSSLVNEDKINKVHEQWFLAFYSISVLSWKASIRWSDPGPPVPRYTLGGTGQVFVTFHWSQGILCY